MAQTKNEIVDEIFDLLGHPVVGRTKGSTGYKTALEAIVAALGLPLDTDVSKPQLAEDIVRYSGGRWHSSFDSRATQSGGGSTVTVSGFQAVLDALDRLTSPTTEVGHATAMDRETAGRSRGQGLQADPALRRATELHAVTLATRHYENQEYDIEDVGALRSFDLIGTRPGGDVIHVEVKGTTGYGNRINLTANEVQHARSCDVLVSLVVVSQIELNKRTGAASGGMLRVLEPWDVQEGRLRPLTFQYLAWDA